MVIAERFLDDFEDEMERLRQVLERAPADHFAWRPHPRSRSLGELALHLARIPGWAGSMLERDAYDLAHEGAPQGRTPPPERADVLALLERNCARARVAIAGASDAELSAPWRLERGGEVVRTLPRVRALRTYLIDHVIHHRGQLGVYLRLLDAPVPALYGSSADEAG